MQEDEENDSIINSTNARSTYEDYIPSSSDIPLSIFVADLRVGEQRLEDIGLFSDY
jgi:hypothetical protein